MRAMKDSGVDYLGNIPAHWDVLEQKWLMRKKKSICEKWQGENVLSLTTNGVVVRDIENGKGKFPATFNGYQYIDAGNLVLCLFDVDVTPRCVGLAKQSGVISPAYSQFVMMPNTDARFYDYYLRAMDDGKLYLGLTSTMRHSFTADAFGLIRALRPPLEEQGRIADFLDEKCNQIDCAITAAEQSIEEYKAYKSRMVEEAVFGIKNNIIEKLDMNCINFIPRGWKIEKLKVHAEFYKGNQVTKSELTVAGKAILNYGQIHSKANSGVHLTENLIRYVPADKVSPASKLKRNDLILATTSEDREALGSAIFVDIDEEIYPGSDSMVCRLVDIACPKYIAYQLTTNAWRNQLRVITNGIKVFHVTRGRVNKTYIAIPPLDEQMNIVNYLDEKCDQIDCAVEAKQAIIDELKAYKKSLIYEVVTGKREV